MVGCRLCGRVLAGRMRWVPPAPVRCVLLPVLYSVVTGDSIVNVSTKIIDKALDTSV